MNVVTSKPKILFILPTDTFGGAERVTFNLLSGFPSFEKVLLTQEAMMPVYEPLGLTIHTFERFGCSRPDISFRNMIGYAKSIRDVSRSEKPAIVFGVMHFASLFAFLAKDIFFLRPKVVASIHGNASSYYGSSRREKTVIEGLLIAYFRRRAKQIIVPSAGIKEDLVNAFGIKADKVIVIYNGFDLDEIRKQGQEAIVFTKDCHWISMAARFNPGKDFLTLLRAFKLIREHTKAKLFLLGEGEMQSTIEDWIAELGLQNDVLLTGFQANPYKYIARSDISVLSSFSEGLPSAIIESMALGIPVVSSDCPSGPSEIIRDGENGYLVPVSDFRLMAERCLRLLTDGDRKRQFSKNCLERAEDFSIKKMCNNYEKFFLRQCCR